MSITQPNLRPLGFGETLDRAFTLYRTRFPLFVGTTFLTVVGVILAGFAFSLLTGVVVAAIPGVMGVIFMLLLLLGYAAVAMIPWAAVTRQAAQAYTGKPTSLGDGTSAGGGAAMTLVGASFVAFITAAVLMLLAFLVAYFLNLVVAALGIAALEIVVGFLTFLAVVAAFWLVGALFFAVVPAVVMEDKGPIEAVSRSLQLAQGALPRIGGVMLVSMIITYLPFLATIWLMGSTMPVPSNPMEDMAAYLRFIGFVTLAFWTLLVVTAPFLMSVIVVLYYDRRVRTEALDVQLMTERLGLAGA